MKPSFQSTFCLKAPADPFLDRNLTTYIGYTLSLSNHQVEFSASITAGILLFITMLIQILLIKKSSKRIAVMKQYSYERPSYCVLSVLIIRVLQCALLTSLCAQCFRILFVLMAEYWGEGITRNNFWIYYIY